MYFTFEWRGRLVDRRMEDNSNSNDAHESRRNGDPVEWVACPFDVIYAEHDVCVWWAWMSSDER